MNTRLVSKTASIAIVAASIFVNFPGFTANPKPSAQPQPTAHTTHTTQTTHTGTIVEVASANSSFKTLVAAIKAADLVETLSAQGPYTVFAPTDKAFAALPKGTLEKLLKPENKATLQKILTYHVVAGKINSKSIKPGAIKTVEGSPLNIKIQRGAIKVSNAKVIKADVKASNGVIHVIDKVLLPPGLKL